MDDADIDLLSQPHARTNRPSSVKKIFHQDSLGVIGVLLQGLFYAGDVHVGIEFKLKYQRVIFFVAKPTTAIVKANAVCLMLIVYG